MRYASYEPESVKYEGISNAELEKLSVRLDAPVGEPGGCTFTSRFDPEYSIAPPKFFMVIASTMPRQPVAYWTPKSNAIPEAPMSRIRSLTRFTLAPNVTRSVNWRAHEVPSTVNGGLMISPVPSGACSVVTITSPMDSTLALKPIEPMTPARIATAA